MNEQQLLGAVALSAGFIILLVVPIVWMRKIKKRQDAAYQTFADRHGFEVKRGRYPMIHGQLDGRSFQMGLDPMRYATGRRKPGMSNAALLLVRMELKDVPSGLLVVKRGLVEKMMKSDVDTGDAQFDSKALVRCSDPAAAKLYLTPARRSALLELLPRSISLQEGGLAFGPAMGKLSMTKLEHLEQTSKPFFDAVAFLDGDADGYLPEPGTPAATVDTSESGAPKMVIGAATGGVETPSNRRVAAWWMGATALVLTYLPSLFSGYFEFWFDLSVLVRVALAGVVAYVAAPKLEALIQADLRRGATLGVAAWLVSSLITASMFWSVGGEISGWFSAQGFSLIGLSAASGAGMAFFLRLTSSANSA